MRHSGNYCTTISTRYLLNGVELKIYTYDELDRFVTVGGLLLSGADLEHHLRGIAEALRRHREEEQVPLPPWQ